MTLFGHLIKVFAGNWVYFDVLFIVTNFAINIVEAYTIIFVIKQNQRYCSYLHLLSSIERERERGREREIVRTR